MAKTPIILDPAVIAREARKALDEGRIQFGECRYSAPCAIGLGLTPEDRARLQLHQMDGKNVAELLDKGVFSLPEGCQTPGIASALHDLQNAHDSITIVHQRKPRFAAALTRLEALVGAVPT